MWPLKGKEDVHFDFLEILHRNSKSETRNDSFCDSQLLIG